MLQLIATIWNVSPQTGDNTQLYIYIAIGVFVSAACAAAITLKKIKANH